MLRTSYSVFFSSRQFSSGERCYEKGTYIRYRIFIGDKLKQKAVRVTALE
jgi:hypothetical protein